MWETVLETAQDDKPFDDAAIAWLNENLETEVLGNLPSIEAVPAPLLDWLFSSETWPRIVEHDDEDTIYNMFAEVLPNAEMQDHHKQFIVDFLASGMISLDEVLFNMIGPGLLEGQWCAQLVEKLDDSVAKSAVLDQWLNSLLHNQSVGEIEALHGVLTPDFPEQIVDAFQHPSSEIQAVYEEALEATSDVFWTDTFGDWSAVAFGVCLVETLITRQASATKAPLVATHTNGLMRARLAEQEGLVLLRFDEPDRWPISDAVPDGEEEEFPHVTAATVAWASDYLGQAVETGQVLEVLRESTDWSDAKEQQVVAVAVQLASESDSGLTLADALQMAAKIED